MANKLGMNAAAYYAASSTSAPTDASGMTLLDNITDVTCNFDKAEADITTRGNSGWRAKVTTVREATVDFEMIWDTEDAGFAAVRNAWLNDTTLAMAFLSEVSSSSTSEGIVGDFSVKTFTKSESLEDAQKVSVSLVLTRFGAWYEGGS